MDKELFENMESDIVTKRELLEPLVREEFHFLKSPQERRVGVGL